MNNLKRQLFIHSFLQGHGIALWLIAVIETCVFVAQRSPLCIYTIVAMLASAWLMHRMDYHCKSYRKAICYLQQLQIAPSLPWPAPAKHKNIRYVTQYKQRGKYAK